MTAADPSLPTVPAAPGEQTAPPEQERPKSLSLLPKITTDALRLVWAASPRLLVASIALKLVNGAGLAVALVFGRNLIGSVLEADAGSTAPGIGAVAPQLVTVVGIIAVLGLVTAAGREVREILSETTARHAKTSHHRGRREGRAVRLRDTRLPRPPGAGRVRGAPADPAG